MAKKKAAKGRKTAKSKAVAAKVKSKLKSFSSKKSRIRKKIHGLVKNEKGDFKPIEKVPQGKLTAMVKEMQEVNREEEVFRKKNKIRKEDVEKKRASKAVKEALANMSTLQIAYTYWERKEFIEYLFGAEKKSEKGKGRKPIKKIKSFIGLAVKNSKEDILSWMDNLFNELDSTRVLVIYQQGDEIIDYLILNSDEA